MKKRIISAIIGAAAAVSALSVSAFAVPETDPDFILDVGDIVEPFDENGDYGEYRLEVTDVDAADEDIYYIMRLIDRDYDVTVRISDTDLWDMGFVTREENEDT